MEKNRPEMRGCLLNISNKKYEDTKPGCKIELSQLKIDIDKFLEI